MKKFLRTLAPIFGVFAVLILLMVAGLLFSPTSDGPPDESETTSNGESRKVVTELRLFYNEDKLEYIPEFPKAEYPGGVKVYYQDGSEDTLPTHEVKYSSDDPEVFVVLENGSICPTGVGTANLTAEYGGKTVTQAFTVKEGHIVSISPAQTETVILSGSADPVPISVCADGSNGYGFEIEDPAQLTVELDGKFLSLPLTGKDFPFNRLTELEVSAYGFTVPVEVISVDPEKAPISASVSRLQLTSNERTVVNVYAEVDGRLADVSHLISWASSDKALVTAAGSFVSASADKCGQAELTATLGPQSLTIPVEVKDSAA